MALSSPARARLHATFASMGTLVLWWRIGGIIPALGATIALCLATLAWTSPRRFAPIQRTLDWLTATLLTCLTWLSLAVVYFGVMTPLRLGRSLFQPDALQLARDPTTSSYLVPVRPVSADRFNRQF